MKAKLKSKDFILILSILLSISILVNIFSISKINVYKYSIGKESYSDIEEIRQRNEGIMEVLNKSLDNGSIRNEEMLQLFKNYNIIATNIINLWQQYSDYTNRSLSIFTKSIESNNIIENDIYGKIKEYMSSTLNKEMRNEESKLILEGKDLECFEVMESMSIRLYDYFNEFNKSKFQGYNMEDREKKVIKYHYWIDMLNGIYDISNDYINVEWNIEVEDQLTADLDS